MSDIPGPDPITGIVPSTPKTITIQVEPCQHCGKELVYINEIYYHLDGSECFLHGGIDLPHYERNQGA